MCFARWHHIDRGREGYLWRGEENGPIQVKSNGPRTYTCGTPLNFDPRVGVTVAIYVLFSIIRECKRTQGVSTTDLVGRMLLLTKAHHSNIVRIIYHLFMRLVKHYVKTFCQSLIHIPPSLRITQPTSSTRITLGRWADLHILRYNI